MDAGHASPGHHREQPQSSGAALTLPESARAPMGPSQGALLCLVWSFFTRADSRGFGDLAGLRSCWDKGKVNWLGQASSQLLCSVERTDRLRNAHGQLAHTYRARTTRTPGGHSHSPKQERFHGCVSLPFRATKVLAEESGGGITNGHLWGHASMDTSPSLLPSQHPVRQQSRWGARHAGLPHTSSGTCCPSPPS